MGEIANYNIYFGAAGWQHIHWQTRFYPSDLPEEWQLSYYNTQFRCVYLPYPLWVNRSLDVAESWLADTQTNFRFILEVPDSLSQQSIQFLEAMNERMITNGAESIKTQLYRFPPEPDLRLLGRMIQNAVDQGRDLYLFNLEAHLPSLEKVRSLVEVMGY